jgi:hypothetical protein
MKFTFDEKKFLKEAERIAIKGFGKVADVMQEQITEEKREYPRLTVRRYGEGKTGRIAESPRDVVDSADLRDSFEKASRIEGNTIIFNATWDAPHASLVYLGTSKIPSYTWVDNVVQTIDWQTIL